MPDETLSPRTVFDAGYEAIAQFEAGRLIRATTFGEQATLGLTFQITEYDENGLIEELSTTFANNTSVTKQFENGKQTARFVRDGEFGDEGIFPWSFKLTSYYGNGQAIDRGTKFDNGVSDVTFNTDGVRDNCIQSDRMDAKPWQEIQTDYGFAGVIEARDTLLDNGITRPEESESGVRSSTLQLDNVSDDGTPAFNGGAKTWETIETLFDENGQIAARKSDFDNGVSRSVVFENGRRIGLFEGDTENVFAWLQKEMAFDFDGNRLLSKTRFDDGRDQCHL